MLMKFYNNIYDLISTVIFNIVSISNITLNLTSQMIVDAKDKTRPILTYYWNKREYKIIFPYTLNKQPMPSIMCVFVNDRIDITEHVKTLSGPYNNFFGFPLKVMDIIPEKYHSEFESVEILTGNLMSHVYTELDAHIVFHYGIDWIHHDKVEYELVRKRLNYLDIY